MENVVCRQIEQNKVNISWRMEEVNPKLAIDVTWLARRDRNQVQSKLLHYRLWQIL